MLRYSTPPAPGEFQQLFEELRREEARLLSLERRSIHREPFVRPVSVEWVNANDPPTAAFSRNISPLGMGLVFPHPVAPGAVGRIVVHRPDRPACTSILSECRWCQEYCGGWHLVGWKFRAIIRRQ